MKHIFLGALLGCTLFSSQLALATELKITISSSSDAEYVEFNPIATSICTIPNAFKVWFTTAVSSFIINSCVGAHPLVNPLCCSVSSIWTAWSAYKKNKNTNINFKLGACIVTLVGLLSSGKSILTWAASEGLA